MIVVYSSRRQRLFHCLLQLRRRLRDERNVLHHAGGAGQRPDTDHLGGDLGVEMARLLPPANLRVRSLGHG